VTPRGRARVVAVGAALLGLGACNGGASNAAGDASTEADSNLPPRDALSDARTRDGAREVGAPIRTATTRPLLATSVESLLIDPFVTSSTNWGHFNAISPTDDLASCPLVVREFLSQSPVGVSSPVAQLSAADGCTEILEPLSGAESGRVNAKAWVSLSDASGQPLPFPANLEAEMTLELMPSYLPGQKPQVVYPLAPLASSDGGALPLTIAGREWGLVGLKAPVPLPQGGFFFVTIVDPTVSFYVAAPEVVPTDEAPLLLPRSREMTDGDRRAELAYERVVRSTSRTPGRAKFREPGARPAAVRGDR
jgi:hypothetical protein